MKTPCFEGIESIRYEGPQSDNPLTLRCYDEKKVVAAKAREGHQRAAVRYWRSGG
jgi:xylose isomerase